MSAPVVAPGAAKEAEPDDPYSMEAAFVPGGEIERMAEAFVEEYARMGMPSARILELFRRPFFGGTNMFYRARGEEATRELITRVTARTGIFRYKENFDA